MSGNKITYYTLLKMKIMNKNMAISGRLYGENINEIKNQLLENNEEQCYGIAFKTIVTPESVTKKNIKEKIENAEGNIQGLADKINSILNSDKWTAEKKKNSYQKNEQKIIINQKMDFLNDDQELKNPIYIKYQKNDKKYIHEPKNIILPQGEKKPEFYKNLDRTYRTDVEFMNNLIAEGNKMFGIYLLEEKIKDTFKGLGNQILQSSNKQLEDRLMNLGIEKLKKKVIKALKNVQMPPNKDVKEAEKLLDKANLMKTIGTIVDPANVYLLGLVD